MNHAYQNRKKRSRTSAPNVMRMPRPAASAWKIVKQKITKPELKIIGTGKEMQGIDTMTTAEKAGFNQPTQTGPKPTPAPMAAAPAPKENSLKTLEGVFGYIDMEKKTAAFKTEEFSVQVIWMQHLNEKMLKFKSGYKAKITYEHAGNSNTLIEIVSLYKKGGGGGNYPPQNERLIVIQSNFRTLMNLFNACTCPDSQDFDAAVELIYGKALDITDRMMKDGAVK
jgi:hypothetical protein